MNETKIECPKCNSITKKHSIVKVKNTGKIDIVGWNKFCTNLNCDSDVDI